MQHVDAMTATQPPGPPPGVPRTVAEAIGQIVWLFSQSPIHRELPIKALETSVMPAVVLEQFRVFRFGPLPGTENIDPASFAPLGMTKEGLEQMPLGVALWAELSEAAEAKLERGEKLSLAEWKSGDRLWLVELISPFATAENKLVEVMLADLMQGPFSTRAFSLHRTDPQTGRRDKLTIGSHVGAASAAPPSGPH
ncbi:MAG: toxin-activating lysine-acyltransferase [Hyphomonadaceae bacterium]|nr:toxin-activating lysine-acyltransferase [Hyphomonadaceae bacterium]